MNYNQFCKSKDCEHFIEWDFEFEYGCQPYPCTSCQLVGQSYDIEEYPEECPFIDDIRNLKTKE